MIIINSNTANFDRDVLGSSILTLVDFWAPWCGPCRILGPIIDEVANIPDFQDKVRFIKVNIDENEELAYKYNISSIPSVKFFKDGEIVSEFIGVKYKDEIVEIINSLIK